MTVRGEHTEYEPARECTTELLDRGTKATARQVGVTRRRDMFTQMCVDGSATKVPGHKEVPVAVWCRLRFFPRHSGVRMTDCAGSSKHEQQCRLSSL